MSTNTTNYNLEKPGLNETADIEVINQNMDIIDTGLKNVSDKADGKISKSLATAANQFLLSSSVGQFVVKTVDEIKSLLGLKGAAEKEFNSAGGVASYDAVQSHLSDYVRQPGYAIATGSVNSYAVTLSPAPTSYIDGMGIVVKISVANTGAATININGLGAKPMVDGKGNTLTSGKLRLNGTYSLKYNSTSGNFILQGSDSSGDATPADLLAGKTASTDAGDITGTMAYKAGAFPGGAAGTDGNGNVSIPITSDGYYPVGASVYSWDGDFIAANIRADRNIYGLQGSIPVRTNTDTGGSYPAAVNDSVYDSNIYLMPPAGYYDGNVWVHRELPGLIAANIRQGVTIGTGGSGKIVGSFAGKSWYQGTATAVGNMVFWYNDNSSMNGAGIEVPLNLTFTPKTILLWQASGPQAGQLWSFSTDEAIYTNGRYPEVMARWGRGFAREGTYCYMVSTGIRFPTPSAGFEYTFLLIG